MSTSWQIVSVFISSMFKDMHVERDDPIIKKALDIGELVIILTKD